jgi:predicted lactoylglutathione lyase
MLNHTEDIDEQNFYVEKFDTLDGTHWEIALDIQQQIQEILDHEAEEQS